MGVSLKPLNEQVIVITGATSGIGLVTARMAARRGARLVLSARSEPALRQLDDELSGQHARVLSIVADVCRLEDVRRIAKAAVEHFGGFDTWVNNAGVTIYGRITEVSLDEQRQLFETNYWGVVHGSIVAAEHLRNRGGAIINVGSVLSDRAIPLQGTYSASKHAVKGFTEALRMELEEENAPISVTLIKPATIDTPYRLHARNYLGSEPKNIGPAYAPETVAEAILEAAQKPVRDVFVGGGARVLATLSSLAPRLMDYFMEKYMFKAQQANRPARHDLESLERPADADLRERGDSPQHVFERSLYTKTMLKPAVASAVALLAGIAVAGFMTGTSSTPAARQVRGKYARAVSQNVRERLASAFK